MGARRFYVVFKGRNVGIYRKLADAKAQTRGYPDAKYYPYTSHADAVEAFTRWNAHCHAEVVKSEGEVVEDIQRHAVRPPPQVSQAEWQPEQLIKYEELTNVRSIIVAECRRAGLSIPRPRSLEMKLAGTSDMYSIIAQINREIRQLYLRWRKVEKVNEAKQTYEDPAEQIASILNDPDLKSDSGLSDFSDPGDDDFVIPPPRYSRNK